MEIQYELRGHGIPIDTFPLDEDGKIREDIRNLWFQKHHQETNQEAPYCRSEVARAGSPGDLNLWKQLLAGGNGDGVGNALLQLGQIDDQMWSSTQNNSNANRQSAGGERQGESSPLGRIFVRKGTSGAVVLW